MTQKVFSIFGSGTIWESLVHTTAESRSSSPLRILEWNVGCWASMASKSAASRPRGGWLRVMTLSMSLVIPPGGDSRPPPRSGRQVFGTCRFILSANSKGSPRNPHGRTCLASMIPLFFVGGAGYIPRRRVAPSPMVYAYRLRTVLGKKQGYDRDWTGVDDFYDCQV